MRTARKSRKKLRRVGLGLLLVLGLGHMAGATLDMAIPGAGKPVADLFRLTLASPHPKVFTRVGDYEAFSFAFDFDVHYQDGARVRQELDAASYARIPGPYMYRNVYGAMLAFSPFLPPSTVQTALAYGLCDGGDLSSTLDRDVPVSHVQIITRSRNGGHAPDPITVTCQEVSP